MASRSFDFHFVPYSAATSSTAYEVWSDEASFAKVADIAASLNPKGVDYAPLTATLTTPLDRWDTTIGLSGADVAHFTAGSYVAINRNEIVKLGTGGPTFTNCLRAQGGTVRQNHMTIDPVTGASTLVYAAHQSYSPTVTFATGRRCVRFTIRRNESGVLYPMKQYLAFYPTIPDHDAYCTVYGTVEYNKSFTQSSAQNNRISDIIPVTDMQVTYAPVDKLTYTTASGTSRYSMAITTYTDADGYWEFQLLRDVFLSQTLSPYDVTGKITVGTGADSIVYSINDVPDKDWAHIQECIPG